MADVADADTVAISLDHPAAGMGHRIPQLDVTLTGDAQEFDGATAQEILDFLPHTFVTEDDVTVTVVESGSRDTDVDATSAAVDLADQHGIDLGSVDGTGKDGRVLKSDVQALID